MAEGLVNAYLGDEWQAFSAGTSPSGVVHPLAIRAMLEIGIDISEGITQSVAEFKERRLDLVVTVCDNAARNCPAWLGDENVIHMPFDDPTKVLGNDEVRMEACRQVRNLMKVQLLSSLRSV
jgi:arsenate reductase